jgi:hypothetical protein
MRDAINFFLTASTNRGDGSMTMAVRGFDFVLCKPGSILKNKARYWPRVAVVWLLILCVSCQSGIRRDAKEPCTSINGNGQEETQQSFENQIIEIARRYIESKGCDAKSWQFYPMRMKNGNWNIYCREGAPMVDAGIWLIVSEGKVVHEFPN